MTLVSNWEIVHKVRKAKHRKKQLDSSNGSSRERTNPVGPDLGVPFWSEILMSMSRQKEPNSFKTLSGSQ